MSSDFRLECLMPSEEGLHSNVQRLWVNTVPKRNTHPIYDDVDVSWYGDLATVTASLTRTCVTGSLMVNPAVTEVLPHAE